MPVTTNDKKDFIKEKNISFYNGIADNYEDILNRESCNKIIRKIVADKFCKIANVNTVLDFGGGTGLDLEWLSNNNYHIYFCEPSSGMRDKAIAYNKNILRNDTIVFLNDKATDFTNWHIVPPFSEKVDAVLSDFAVINCIPDIELLFKNLAQVMKVGGNLIALVLHYDFKKIIKSNLRGSIKSFFLQKPLTTTIKYNGNEQMVFIYSIKDISKAFEPHFILSGHEYLKEYGFCLLHLTRK
jgi:SAM-dependent methyltransferase